MHAINGTRVSRSRSGQKTRKVEIKGEVGVEHSESLLLLRHRPSATHHAKILATLRSASQPLDRLFISTAFRKVPHSAALGRLGGSPVCWSETGEGTHSIGSYVAAAICLLLPLAAQLSGGVHMLAKVPSRGGVERVCISGHDLLLAGQLCAREPASPRSSAPRCCDPRPASLQTRTRPRQSPVWPVGWQSPWIHGGSSRTQ